ncbi:MAG: DUF488 family protein [Solirubrobacteraceae bacterium]
MEIYTIGFTQTSAEHFFDRLAQAGVRRLLDVRLKNTSHLAGFAKSGDLPFFLERLNGIRYDHEPLLAPSEELLSAYRKRQMDWSTYEEDFIELLAAREVQSQLDPEAFKTPTVLLCSEATADCCHRRLVCEYLSQHWGQLHAEHL